MLHTLRFSFSLLKCRESQFTSGGLRNHHRLWERREKRRRKEGRGKGEEGKVRRVGDGKKAGEGRKERRREGGEEREGQYMLIDNLKLDNFHIAIKSW